MMSPRKQTLKFDKPVYIESTGTAVGPMEGAGPLRHTFDQAYDNLYCGEDSWELAERRLMQDAIEHCLKKVHVETERVSFMIAGDLLNQNITANYVARALGIPFLGTFSACATSMETLAVGSIIVHGGFAQRVITAASSHYATAERQFRQPTEFAKQKPDSATYTVTGAGAALVSNRPSKVRIESATIGHVVDYGLKNPLDLGSAMAPAAAHTIVTHLEETDQQVDNYDLIVTGDLSRIGSGILRKLLEEKRVMFKRNYDDCGVMIYSMDQPVFAGGSGAACSAVVSYGHIFEQMKKGKLKKVLIVATGALLNPMMIQQKETIPCIAHAVSLRAEV